MDHFWKHCLKQFSARFDESSFSAFIQPTVTRTEGDLFLIVSPNSTVDRWLKKNLEPSFKEFFESAYPTKNYRFVVEKKGFSRQTGGPLPFSRPASQQRENGGGKRPQGGSLFRFFRPRDRRTSFPCNWPKECRRAICKSTRSSFTAPPA